MTFTKKSLKPVVFTQGSIITLATLCTFMRILLTPIIIYLIVNHVWYAASIVFCCAVLTDFLDGFIARFFNQESALGAALDPIADKCLILGIVTTLWLHPAVVHIPWWLLTFLWFKEIILILGGIFLWWRNGQYVVRPSFWGKIAMVITSISIVVLLVAISLGISIDHYLFVLYAGIVASSALSLGWYGLRELKFFFDKKY